MKSISFIASPNESSSEKWIHFTFTSLCKKNPLKTSNYNGYGLLLYLSNCASLLSSSRSITWHVCSQHLLRLGCLLPGHSSKLLLSKHSPASLLHSPRTCQRLAPFLSFCQTQGSCYCSAIYLRWSLTLL